MQLFTKMANRWAERDCEDDECAPVPRAARRDARARDDGARLVSDQPREPRPRAARAVDRVVRRRAATVRGAGARLPRVASRATSWTTREAGIARNADAISEALAQVPGARSSASRRRPARARRSARRSRSSRRSSIASTRSQRDRVGVCVDTCHVYSAGYDLVNDYDGVMARLRRHARPGAAARDAPQRLEDAVRVAGATGTS